MRAHPPLNLRLGLLVLGTLALTGCGPEREDIGAGALMIVAVSNVFLALFMLPVIAAWRMVRPHLETRWLAFVLVALAQLGVAWHFGRTDAGTLRVTPEMLLYGAWAVMPGYVGLSLILFRMFWAGGWPWGQGLAPLLGCLPVVVPAVLMTRGSSAGDDFVPAWILGGGLLPIGLAVLLIEAGVRQRRAR